MSEARKPGRVWGFLRFHHVLFVLTLAALVALGWWWTTLLWQQIRITHESRLELLELQVELEAMRLAMLPPGATPPAGESYQIVSAAEATAERRFSLAPSRPDLALRIRPELLSSLDEKRHRRQLMVVGEGSFLFLLITVCIVMLAWLFHSERKARTEIETFFRAVSHELKTPVAGLSALLQTLSTGRIAAGDLERTARLGLRETERLRGLVENVLLASRIDRRIFQAELRAVPAVAEMRRYLERRGRLFAGQTVRFDIACSEAVEVMVDPELVRRVLDNLFDNAFKYSSPDALVTVRLIEDASWVGIEVIDRGVGFDPDEKEAIFEKGRRGRRHESFAKGSGLGLYIARESVRACGGELIAESDGEGQGSRFTVRLRKAESGEPSRKETKG